MAIARSQAGSNTYVLLADRVVFVSEHVRVQEKEYKMCLEAYNEKSNEKATLVNRLLEVSSILLQSARAI